MLGSAGPARLGALGRDPECSTCTKKTALACDTVAAPHVYLTAPLTCCFPLPLFPAPHMIPCATLCLPPPSLAALAETRTETAH